MAVEAVAGFEPERVARAEPGGLEPERLARLHERLPDGLDALGLAVDLKAGLAGVAGVREDRALAAQKRAGLGLDEVVVLDLGERDVRELLGDLERLRSLEREERRPLGLVVHGDVARERFVLGADVREVLLDVRRVDDEEVGVLGEAVDEEVIHGAAVAPAHHGVHRAAVRERARVVRDEALHEAERVGAGDDDLAHVGDVEEAGGLAHGAVLVEDARVLHRHLEAAERHHLGPERLVCLVERGALEGGDGGLHAGCGSDEI